MRNEKKSLKYYFRTNNGINLREVLTHIELVQMLETLQK